MRKIIATVLLFTLIITLPSAPAAYSVSSEPALNTAPTADSPTPRLPLIQRPPPAGANIADVYKAYYDILKATTDEYGIGENPRPFQWNDSNVLVGVLYAELIRFGDSVTPQLAYHYDWGYAPGHYVTTVKVYDYAAGAEPVFTGSVGGHGTDVFVVTDRAGVSYIHEIYYGGFYEDDPVVEQYFTMRNGRWVEVPVTEIDIAGRRALSIIDADAVYAVLAELQSSQVTPPPQPAGSQIVNPATSTIYLNGTAKAFDAYLIDDANYFKLRDLAFVLNGTQKQFEIGYDNATRAIMLISGRPYTAVGGEMALGDGRSKNATPTLSTIYLDGLVLDLVVYNIDGNNFFKLREIMEALDVYVGYDNTTRAITLDTSRGYVA